MYCTNCGKELPNTSKFCIYCGAEVTPKANTEINNLLVTKEPKNSVEEPNKPELNTEVINEVSTNSGATKSNHIQMNSGASDSVMSSATAISKELDQVPRELDQVPKGLDLIPKEIDHVHSGMTPRQATPKKRTGILLIAIGCLVGVLILGSVGFYFLIQNRMMKQAETVVALFDDEEFEKAQDIYSRYQGKNRAFNKNIIEELKIRIESIKEEYLAERMGYETAMDHILAISAFEIVELYELTDNSIAWIIMIGSSRDSYQQAKAFFDQGDYEGAIAEYQLVVQEDPYYYNLAVNEMAIAEQALLEEEQRQQEEVRINEIREAALAEAAYYEQYNDYMSAITAIENGLIDIPEDEVLSEKLAYYQELGSMSQQANNITSTLYEHTYFEQDIKLLTVTMELPKLNGDSYAYHKINQVFEDFLQGYLVSNDTWAEDTKAYAYDVNFYTNSLDFTYTVQYNRDGLLCIMLEGYSFTGGVHGYPIRLVYTFDLATGELLNLSDLMAVDENEFWPVVIGQLQQVIDEYPEGYWGDAQSMIGERGYDYDSMDYYLTEEGICIFFYPYDLASYAMGFVEAVVPYEGNEWMFNLMY